MTTTIAVEVLDNFIAGRWMPGGGPTFTSTSPHDPSIAVGHGTCAGRADVDTAVAAANEAARTWRCTPAHERAACLVRAAAVIEANLDLWAGELAREEGKPIVEARGEVARAAQILRYNATHADTEAGQLFSSPRPGEKILVDHRPRGVVAVISPFNFPIAIPAWKLAPALAYGNTVVWKPPTSVALLAKRLTEALDRAGLPAGVLSLVHGEREVGQWLTEHPGVDAVTFTGSTPVGRAIAASCAARGVPVQAEMGGKNAAIVLPDADITRAVHQVLSGAFRSSGQKCTATSRLVLHENVADRFLDEFLPAVTALVVGDPEDEDTYVGPLVSEAARNRVGDAIDRAVAEGARMLARANHDGSLPGHYTAPTVLEVDDTETDLWNEELFGPVLTVVRAPDLDHALRAANAGPFGLSVAVFTADLSTALSSIEDLNVGMVHVNSETAGADPHVPFGGNKASSYGPREQGAAAKDFFTTTTTTYLKA